MENDDVEKVRSSPVYQEILKTIPKHIFERTFHPFKMRVIEDVWGELPVERRSFFGAMGWFTPKTNAVYKAIEMDGITIHNNGEYEEEFKKWYGECLPKDWKNIPISKKLEFYHQKREEFVKFYNENFPTPE